jgi:putative membrane protein
LSDHKRLLVLVVDIDADLQEKAKVKGPVVGRKAVSEAATKLAIADPAEVDANAMFQGIKLYDELGADHDVEIATLTGSPRLGYTANSEIVKQLEAVLKQFKPEACVFVTDGASDEQVLPLVQSRIRINSVHTVVVKQTKELEKTYFVLLDKLKEPAFARIVFGIPGLALALFYLFGVTGLRAFVGMLGGYLILKAIGIEDWIVRIFTETKISFDRISSVFYFAAVPLAIVAIGVGINKVVSSGETELLKQAAIFIKELVLLVVALLLTIIGNALEAYYERRNYLYPSFLINASALILFWVLFTSAADWILGTTGFGEFFGLLLLVVAVMFLIIFLAREFRKDILAGLRLEGKEVYTELGSLLGKIVGINKRKETFIIETESGQKIDLDLNHIAHIGEKVVVRY